MGLVMLNGNYRTDEKRFCLWIGFDCFENGLICRKEKDEIFNLCVIKNEEKMGSVDYFLFENFCILMEKYLKNVDFFN